jgi:hypothetical protein
MMPKRLIVGMRRPELSPAPEDLHPTVLRTPETTSITTHSHGHPPIDTALPSSPGPAAPATSSPRLPPTALTHQCPPCLHYPQGPVRRVPETARSTAAEGSARNTAARQVPTAVTQQASPEPESGEQDLWRARIGRRQEAHGIQEIPQYDESRGHLLALVPPQSGNSSVDHNGSAPFNTPTDCPNVPPQANPTLFNRAYSSPSP